MTNKEIIYNSKCKTCGIIEQEDRRPSKEYPVVEQDVCGDGPTLLARLILCVNCLAREHEQSRENT